MAYVPRILRSIVPYNPATDVAFSQLMVNSENVKFVAINISDHNVYLTRTGFENIITTPTDSYFGIDGMSLIKQANAKYTIELSYGDSQDLTIESKLIQSAGQAEGIASFIEQIYHIKQRAFEIEIFGNPFVQIGDIVNVIYNYGKINIDDTARLRKCLVIGINQHFEGGGLSTTLKVRLLERE
jgi:hypothetical protein